jgi:serine/threonine-protein kinase
MLSHTALVGGRYALLEPIGVGGTSTVYRATDRSSGRDVAVKLLHPDVAKSAEARLRLSRENDALGRVASPHVARVLGHGVEPDGTPWIAAELIDGPRLTELLGASPAGLPPARAIRLVLDVLEGLSALHAVGVAHRDLKPDNVFVVAVPGGERAVVFDLSCAALEGATDLTPSGQVMGSPAYTSPERLVRRTSDPVRGDVWAAGVLLYELLTGEQPFRGSDLPTLLEEIAIAPPPPLSAYRPGLSRALDEIVETALAKAPEARYPSAGAMREALCRAMGKPDT